VVNWFHFTNTTVSSEDPQGKLSSLIVRCAHSELRINFDSLVVCYLVSEFGFDPGRVYSIRVLFVKLVANNNI
jgi:hypothetical protein